MKIVRFCLFTYKFHIRLHLMSDVLRDLEAIYNYIQALWFLVLLRRSQKHQKLTIRSQPTHNVSIGVHQAVEIADLETRAIGVVARVWYNPKVEADTC